MGKLKSDSDYISALEDCKAVFCSIEDGTVKSISTARKIARSAIDEVNEFLYASDREKVLQRIRFRRKRGNDINGDDIDALLKICEELL